MISSCNITENEKLKKKKILPGKFQGITNKIPYLFRVDNSGLCLKNTRYG